MKGSKSSSLIRGVRWKTCTGSKYSWAIFMRGGPINFSSISASVGPSGSSKATPLLLRSSASNSYLGGVQCTLVGSAGGAG